MTGSKSNREVLAMETSHPDHVVSFGKKSGCYVSKGVGFLLAVFFVSAVVATGLLVYYYAPDIKASQHESLILHSTMKPPMTKTPTKPATTTTLKTTTTPATTTTTTTTATSTSTTTPKPMSTTLASDSIAESDEKTKKKIDVRLPTSLKPLHYLVKLQPLINGNFSILGYVEVEMEVLESTSNITLHICDIITYNDTIKVRPSGNLDSSMQLGIQKHAYDHEREFYIAHLEKPLEKGQKYTLSMHFRGYLNDQLEGFYRSTYKDSDGTDKLLAATQFQATDARKAFPCFDEPGLKATFEVYLARETNMSSISNMPIIETLPMEGQDNWVWDHFDTSVPMSTYLVAFVVSDFVNMTAPPSNSTTLFRVWARESAIQQAEYAKEVGPAILTHFEEYFNAPYPLPKQDMIAIPDFSAGAMENWGLITYRETAMLYDPKVSAAHNKQYVVSVVAHELAHQWFGNLVTPKWWTDLWLNEGFASYVEYIGIDHVEPSWKVMEQLVLKEVQSVFGLDSMESSHPISIPVQHPDDIGQIFDRISYSKGASIIRMMNHFLTEKSFRKGLSNYLNAFKYENAEQDDLWHYLTMAAHEDGVLPLDLSVKTIMDTWTLQMGYPVIKVTRSEDGTTAAVTQERFLMVKSENSTDDHDYKWWVPLNYATGQEPYFNHTQAMTWMPNSESEITLSSLPTADQWVLFNIHETGYYRVNYDDNNWKMLIKQLNDDHTIIHAINRAQMIDDAMNLAKAGQLSYDTALSIYGYLGKETDYVPWAAAINNLGYLKGTFSRTGAYGALRSYLLDILVPLYNSVGFVDRTTDPLLDQYKRQKAIAWTCALDYKDCLDNAVTLFHQWMANPSNTSIISPNLKSTVYCRAIAEGGEDEWNFAWTQYLKSNVGSEKTKLLSALGCTKQVWILSRYLEMAFAPNSGIRKQDSYRVFGAVAGNLVGRPLAWNFLLDKWDMIYAFYGKAKPHLIKYATQGFNTLQMLKEVELFKKEHEKELGTATRAVEQVIESTKININWINTNYDVIVEWLDTNGYSTKLNNNV